MKNKIIHILSTSIQELGYPIEDIIVQTPKNPKHGDFTTNYPLITSKKIKLNPMDLANKIVLQIQSSKDTMIERIESVSPGFINIKVTKTEFSNKLPVIISEDESYGRSSIGENKKALVEFVSANPTGPLTIGHGRNAILGDTISRILDWNGYSVYKEYYFNNAGRQMRVLGESVYARYMQCIGENCDIPDGGYEGEYIKNIAEIIATKHKDKLKDDKENPIFREKAEKYIFDDIETTLHRIGLKFDSFFNENTLYDSGEIEKTIDDLKNKNLVYNKDGAVWFKASDAGREEDRVIVKSSGEPTYRLPDIAYHIDKYKRGYDLMIDVFGADHKDAYPDVMAAIDALGYSTNKTKVLIHQFVTILKDGEPVKMSTRKANFITLNKLVEEVGPDVTRFFFIMRSMNTHLNFDIDLAKEQSDVNPIFYIQYAHARCCNIIKRFNGEINQVDNSLLNQLTEDAESLIIAKLIEFPDVVKKCAQTLEPQNISNYLSELASSLHSYYAKTRVVDNSNIKLSGARIYLINATRIVLRNGLNILGVSSPEKM